MDGSDNAPTQAWVENAKIESQRLSAVLNKLKRYTFAGLPLSVLLTAVFYLQGRAYRYSYLRQLGLDESLLPLTTPEVFWLSMHGWMSYVVLMLKGMPSAYYSILKEYGLPIWALTFAGFWLLILVPQARYPSSKFSAWKRFPYLRKASMWVRRSRRKSRIGLVWTVSNFAIGLVSSALLVLASVSFVPMILSVFSFAIVLFFLLVVFPFFKVGETAAVDLCAQDRATMSTAIFESGAAGSRSSAYLIECREIYCALVDQAGQRFIIPAGDVKRIDAPARRQKGDRPHQLCDSTE